MVWLSFNAAFFSTRLDFCSCGRLELCSSISIDKEDVSEIIEHLVVL